MNELMVFTNSEFGEVINLEKSLKDTYLGIVYAIEYGDMLKIGHSSKPYSRIMALKRNAEKYGNLQIGRVCISQSHTNHKEVESFLHGVFSQYRKEGTELFQVKFDDFVRDFEEMEIDFKDETKEIEARSQAFLAGMKNFILGGRNE